MCYVHFTGRSSEATRTPSLSCLSQHQLGFRSRYYPAFGYNNEVLIRHNSQLFFFKLISKGYFQVWNKPIPEGTMISYGAIAGSGEILLGTRCYDQDFQLLKTFPNHGYLLDSTEDNHMIFCQNRQKQGDYLLRIWKVGNKKPVVTLQPPEGQTWNQDLSVCYVANSIVVVVDGWTKTMDLFTKEGNMYQSK